jgi:hypothetical protein
VEFSDAFIDFLLPDYFKWRCGSVNGNIQLALLTRYFYLSCLRRVNPHDD